MSVIETPVPHVFRIVFDWDSEAGAVYLTAKNRKEARRKFHQENPGKPSLRVSWCPWLTWDGDHAVDEYGRKYGTVKP